MFRLIDQPSVIAMSMSDEDNQTLCRAIEVNPLKYFCPNGAQEKYIRTVAESTEKTKIPVVLCTFANGVGKTTCSIHIPLNIIFGPQNGWFDYPLFHKWPFPKVIWYCSTAEALSETIEPMFDEVARPDLWTERKYTTDKKGKTHISKITFPNGWIINFKTYNQDPKTFESANVGLIIADEPAPEVIWKALKSRRRKGCVILLPMTPLYCPPYVIDEVQEASNQGKKGYYHVKADVYEACMKRGIRGHLDADIIDDMVEGYDEEEKQARAFGEFMYFSGRIYPNLSRSLHMSNSEDFPIPFRSKILHIVDPHDSRPSAAIWAAKTPLGRFIIINETPTDTDRPFWQQIRTDDVDAEVMLWASIEAGFKEEVSERILDRHFGWQTRGQKNFAQDYLESSMKIGKVFTFQSSYIGPSKNEEIIYGHKRVRKLMKPMADGKPGLIIWDNCHHTWNGLSHYIRKHLKGVIAEDKIQADAPIVEKYKDFPDVVRYMACSDVMMEIPVKKMTYSERLKQEAIKDAKMRKTGEGGQDG